ASSSSGRSSPRSRASSTATSTSPVATGTRASGRSRSRRRATRRWSAGTSRPGRCLGRRLSRVDRAELTRSLADLAVGLGANVQPGQIVTVGADHGQAELARAIAESAYRRGAKFVDVQYFDPYVKRARIAYAAADTLEFVPSWYSYRMLAIGEERAARISLAGPTTT